MTITTQSNRYYVGGNMRTYGPRKDTMVLRLVIRAGFLEEVISKARLEKYIQEVRRRGRESERE